MAKKCFVRSYSVNHLGRVATACNNNNIHNNNNNNNTNNNNHPVVEKPERPNNYMPAHNIKNHYVHHKQTNTKAE